MALASLDGAPLVYPPMPFGAAGAITVTNSTYVLDAASEKAAIVAQAMTDLTVQNICFRTGTVTTGANLDLRIETVGTDGLPSGTLWNSPTNTTNVAHVLGNGDDNLWVTSAALTASASITKGQFFAIVLSTDGGNFQITSFSDVQQMAPYGLHFTASYAKQTTYPSLAIKTSGGAFVPLGGNYWPAISAADTNFNLDSTPDERGNVVTLPFKARAVGIAVWGFGTTANSYDLILYDTNGTSELGKITIDGDFGQNPASSGYLMYFFDDDPPTLSAGSQYRVAMRPATTTNVNLSSITFGEAGALDCIPGGSNVHHTQQTGAGGWTQTATQRNLISLLLDQLDDGAGGAGGMIVHPGMNARLV